MVKQKSVVIYDWMIQQIGLEGLDRDVYAVVYGLTRYSSMGGYIIRTRYIENFFGVSSKEVEKALYRLSKEMWIYYETYKSKYDTVVVAKADFDYLKAWGIGEFGDE